MTRQTTRRLEPSTSNQVGSQVWQVWKTTAPEVSMATPVRKMMMRMMTMERQVEVTAALSSSSLFCLEINLEICFSRIDGLVWFRVILVPGLGMLSEETGEARKLIKIWRRQQTSGSRPGVFVEI